MCGSLAFLGLHSWRCSPHLGLLGPAFFFHRFSCLRCELGVFVLAFCILVASMSLRHAIVLAALCSFRFGEASYPGPVNSTGSRVPDSQSTFVLGAVNPTGLNGKHGLLSDLPRGVFAISETHLSTRGVELFRSGLHFAKSHFRYVAGPPAPTRARSHVTGDYTGVGFLSSFAGRAARIPLSPRSSLRLAPRWLPSWLVRLGSWVLWCMAFRRPPRLLRFSWKLSLSVLCCRALVPASSQAIST